MIPFKALACDFDGTLAVEDRVEPEVKGSLEQARRMGVRLILVTGRTFFELTRVCDCLELFDAVVAENGSVIYHPGSAMIRDLGPAVPARLLAELDRRGTYYQAGRVIVGTARADEMAVREALSTAGVSRDLITNRAALMLLPSGLSKGSGVEQVLRFLELSPHDVLARGDAENDLALFGAPGLGTLRRVCDRSGGRLSGAVAPAWRVVDGCTRTIRRGLRAGVHAAQSIRLGNPRSVDAATREEARPGRPRASADPRDKYVDSVVAPGREFLFRSSHGRVLASANSLQSFRQVAGPVPGDILTHHAGRGDFSRWVRDVFGDTELARQIGKAEVRFQRGELADLRAMIDILITARYGGGS